MRLQNIKYIVETKIWEGIKRYQAGKRQLAEYPKLEGFSEGYYKDTILYSITISNQKDGRKKKRLMGKQLLVM